MSFDTAEQVTVRVEPVLVGVEDAGRVLGISAKGIRRMIAADELPSVMVGGRRLLAVDDLRAWAAGLERTSGVDVMGPASRMHSGRGGRV